LGPSSFSFACPKILQASYSCRYVAKSRSSIDAVHIVDEEGSFGRIRCFSATNKAWPHQCMCTRCLWWYLRELVDQIMCGCSRLDAMMLKKCRSRGIHVVAHGAPHVYVACSLITQPYLVNDAMVFGALRKLFKREPILPLLRSL
jgi:hypothetical protein